MFMHLLTATFKDLHIENSRNYKRWYTPPSHWLCVLLYVHFPWSGKVIPEMTYTCVRWDSPPECFPGPQCGSWRACFGAAGRSSQLSRGTAVSAEAYVWWGFMLLPGLWRKYSFIYIFIYYSPSNQFTRAKILNYRNYVRNGYDVGSEIANVSARHVALKRWTVTNKR